MSRRDTIIIAVLINVGLLTILFATARNMDGQQDLQSRPSSQPLLQERPLGAATDRPGEPGSQLTQLDEVDRAIASFEGQTPGSPVAIGGALQPGMTNQASMPNQTGFAAQTGYPTQPGQPAQPGFATQPGLGNQAGMAATSTMAAQSPSSANAPIAFAEESLTPAADNAELTEVTVKRGDTLDRIARSNNTTVDAIVQQNGLKNTRLTIGQKLRLPASTKAVAAKSSAATPVANSSSSANSSKEAKYYVVQSGDNPWLIARRHNIPLEELLKLNRLDDAKARQLKVGDRIRIQ